MNHPAWHSAALNGLVGLKPTLGRVSTRGVIPYCWTFEHVGILAGPTKNLLKIRQVLEDAGVIFIDENGGGPGVRLRDRVSDQ